MTFKSQEKGFSVLTLADEHEKIRQHVQVVFFNQLDMRQSSESWVGAIHYVRLVVLQNRDFAAGAGKVKADTLDGRARCCI